MIRLYLPVFLFLDTGINNYFMAEINFDDSDESDVDEVIAESSPPNDVAEKKLALFPVPPWKKGLADGTQQR